MRGAWCRIRDINENAARAISSTVWAMEQATYRPELTVDPVARS